MVRGLDKFKEYFKGYEDSYVIIGGTARDIIISEAEFEPKGTKDIDIILIVEALKPEFGKQFWKFIIEGKYERKEEEAQDRRYYRFTKPAFIEFPFQIELFSRKPEAIVLPEDAHLTPIPLGDDLTSLSAILLNNEYYNYMIKHSTMKDGLRIAMNEALICLKAKAFLELTERIANGSKEDPKHIKKHKEDIFRLAALLAEDNVFELPDGIKNHLQEFADAVAADLPGQHVFENMKMDGGDMEKVFQQFKTNFKLE